MEENIKELLEKNKDVEYQFLDEQRIKLSDNNAHYKKELYTNNENNNNTSKSGWMQEPSFLNKDNNKDDWE